MALPGFTADASVGPTTQIYRMRDRYGTAEGAHLYLQSNGAEGGEDLGDYEETMDMAEEDVDVMEMAEEDAEDLDLLEEEVEVGDAGEVL